MGWEVTVPTHFELKEGIMSLDVYTNEEIASVTRKDGVLRNISVRVQIKPGTQKILCGCECGGYVPISLAMQGWRFMRGHSLKGSKRSVTGKFKGGAGEELKIYSPAVDYYQSWMSKLRMDITNVQAEFDSLTKQLQQLKLRADEKYELLKRLQLAANGLRFLVDKNKLLPDEGCTTNA